MFVFRFDLRVHQKCVSVHVFVGANLIILTISTIVLVHAGVYCISLAEQNLNLFYILQFKQELTRYLVLHYGSLKMEEIPVNDAND